MYNCQIKFEQIIPTNFFKCRIWGFNRYNGYNYVSKLNERVLHAQTEIHSPLLFKGDLFSFF